MSNKFPSIWLEISTSHKDSTIFGGFYREWSSNGSKSDELQLQQMICFTNQVKRAAAKNSPVIITGDANLCSVKWHESGFLYKNIGDLLKETLELEGMDIAKTGHTYQAD